MGIKEALEKEGRKEGERERGDDRKEIDGGREVTKQKK